MRKQSTARKLKSQPATTPLSANEIKRIVEMVAAELDNGSEEIALLTLLFDHMGQLGANNPVLLSTVSIIKRHLFLCTPAASDAQELFQAEAFRTRGKLLRFPCERKERA